MGMPRMADTVADQMVEVFADAGVERIYGIVGDSLNGITDALRRHGAPTKSSNSPDPTCCAEGDRHGTDPT